MSDLVSASHNPHGNHPERLGQERVSATAQKLEQVLYELKKIVVGQEYLLERLLVAVIAGGHVLVEGAPGLAKTLTLKTLADVLAVAFKRIQFTPDLLPGDLIGTRIYHPAQGHFNTELGPIFANFILADEINRSPAKVQSALLEAMQEQQVTIGKETYPLAAPFLVMATQNPIESEGTYPLPEAQLDRFLFKLLVAYPNAQEELTIIQRMSGEAMPVLEKVLNAEQLLAIREQAAHVYLDPKIMEYIVRLVQATRSPEASARPSDFNISAHLYCGASPRGSLSLSHAARALALLRGRNYVLPADITALAKDCLRHRLLLTYEAIAQGHSADSLLDSLLESNPAPTLTA
ncbi:MAG: MoxR family ATPase [Vampirovibrionales bacterium]|nr:MoxR family ATPase [Vampirovibrionales bacterium]